MPEEDLQYFQAHLDQKVLASAEQIFEGLRQFRGDCLGWQQLPIWPALSY